MPPKPTVTTEEILKNALDIVRQCGMEALNARTLAKQIGCSTQPIFSNFANMAQLQNAVFAEAYRLYCGYLEREMQREDMPKYKLSGLGYIRFAGEEKELFKLLFMRDRANEEQSLASDPGTMAAVELLSQKYGFSHEKAHRFHDAMWIFVHGIGSMIATGFLVWDEKTISDYTSKAFYGFLSAFSKEDAE